MEASVETPRRLEGEKAQQGVVRLQTEPEAVASVLFVLGDGMGIQVLSEPDWDSRPSFELGERVARRLLGEGEL